LRRSRGASALEAVRSRSCATLSRIAFWSPSAQDAGADGARDDALGAIERLLLLRGPLLGRHALEQRRLGVGGLRLRRAVVGAVPSSFCSMRSRRWLKAASAKRAGPGREGAAAALGAAAATSSAAGVDEAIRGARGPSRCAPSMSPAPTSRPVTRNEIRLVMIASPLLVTGRRLVRDRDVRAVGVAPHRDEVDLEDRGRVDGAPRRPATCRP